MNTFILDAVEVAALKNGSIYADHKAKDGKPCIQFNATDTDTKKKWTFYLYGEQATEYKKKLSAGQVYRIVGSIRVQIIKEKEYYIVDVASLDLRSETAKPDEKKAEPKKDPYALDPLMFGKSMGIPSKVQ